MKRLLLMAPLLAVLVLGCGPRHREGLVSQIPWGDREKTVYIIQSYHGVPVGGGEMEIFRRDSRFVFSQRYRVGEFRDEIRIEVDARTLKPVSESRTLNTTKGKITLDTRYEDGKLSIELNTPEGPKSATMTVPEDAYDNDEVLFLFRTLPFREGYSTSYTHVIPINALKPKATVKVLSREKVSTPGGEFEAWKLEVKVGVQKQYIWYAVEKPHLLVKYDNGQLIFLLKSRG